MTIETIASSSGVTATERTSSASFARPADTTPYSALDVVSDSTSAPTVLTFTGVGRSAGAGGIITKARILTDLKTCTARFRLHLYSVAPTAINDNSPMLALWANRAVRVGKIDFVAMTTEDPTSSTAAYSEFVDIPLPFNCATGSNKLYGILETLDIFTPASAQNFFIELTAE